MHHDLTLYYIHDPMCSWCYGFKPVLELLTNQLKDIIEIKYYLGGLAEDADTVMSNSMQVNIQSNWKSIEQTIPGISFNYNFWELCIPKRSTYASCRAVIAAKKQHQKFEYTMINAIQEAYYLNARNPSDYDVLYELAKETGLNQQQFKSDIHSDEVNSNLMQQILFCRKIGADSFPSLFVLSNNNYYPIALDYNNADIILDHIKSYIPV